MLDVVRLSKELKKNPLLFDSFYDTDSKIYGFIYFNINQVLKVAA